MKALVFYLVIVPLAIVLIVLGATNRDSVTIVLDPFSPADPALAVSVPLYILVFGSIILGIVIGGVADWMRQGRFRKAARLNKQEAARWQREANALKSSADAGNQSLTVSNALTASRSN